MSHDKLKFNKKLKQYHLIIFGRFGCALGSV